MQEDSANGEVEVGRLDKNGNEVRLKVPATGRDFNLKAGQMYKPGTDAVSEVSAHGKPENTLKGVIGGADSEIGNPPKSIGNINN